MTARSRHAYRPRMELTRRRKWMIYGVLGSCWLSGVAWLIAHYWLAQAGEPSPFEAWSLIAHGATAFAMLWLAGWLWAAHIQPWWSSGKRRVSGIVLCAAVLLLIVSGHLLYYAAGDSVREWTAFVHWIIGLAIALVMFFMYLMLKSHANG